jgi:small subunit ribosomal protein S1
MRKGAQKIDTEGLYSTENYEPVHASIGEITDANGLDEEALHGNRLKRLYEESLKGFREGEIIEGEVVDRGEGFILVDIGYKSEGLIPDAEFRNSDGSVSVEIGDRIEVFLVRREDEEGRPVLSRKAVGAVKRWNQIKEAYEERHTVRGKIISRVRGGFLVDIGINAFLPRSQFDRRPIVDEHALIGTEHEFKILQYDKKSGNVVLSRRAVVEEQRTALRRETLERIKEGEALQGKVTNITPYGLFVDVGGVDGLVHISDITWSKREQPLTLYSIGDEITVKVLSIDRETEKASLGIKQLSADPWEKAKQKYPVGGRVTGRVVEIRKYGAFVELEPGIEGMVHRSDMSWTAKIHHPSQILNIGDSIEAIVLEVDIAAKRISLGIKQLEPNPWETIDEEYPVGAIIEGRIKNIEEFGLFIGIDKGIDGLVHVSDISWTEPKKHPGELYKKGQNVRAVVLDIDKDSERFSLGIKQLTPDPWDGVEERYKKGDKVTGRVTAIADFGLFVELERGIEGLIHVSELPKEEGKNPLSRYEVGVELEAKVLGVSQEERKIGLSTRRMGTRSRKTRSKRRASANAELVTSLGDLIKEEMSNP